MIMIAVSMNLEMFLNLKEYGYGMVLYKELSLTASYGKSLTLPERLAIAGMLKNDCIVRGEVYFNPPSSTLPLEMREKMNSAGWYGVTNVHIDHGNVSYDVRTPNGILERVGYNWFEKIRWPTAD